MSCRVSHGCGVPRHNGQNSVSFPRSIAPLELPRDEFCTSPAGIPNGSAALDRAQGRHTVGASRPGIGLAANRPQLLNAQQLTSDDGRFTGPYREFAGSGIGLARPMRYNTTNLSHNSLDHGLAGNTRPMANTFILIPGRTARQGCGISEGKFGDTYQSETHLLQVAADDMQRLGLTDGDRVRVRSTCGEIEVPVISAKGDDLPAGLLFIPYGDLSSRLMGDDTHGSGMPTSKGLDVELEVLEPQ